MVTIQVFEDDLLSLLMERVASWNGSNLEDYWVYELYKQYYQNMLDSGAFNGSNFDVEQIVDNDWVNWLTFYSSKKEAIDDYDPEDWYEERVVAELDSGEVLIYSC